MDFVGWWILFVLHRTLILMTHPYSVPDFEEQVLTQCTCAVARLDFAASTFKYSKVIIVQA